MADDAPVDLAEAKLIAAESAQTAIAETQKLEDRLRVAVEARIFDSEMTEILDEVLGLIAIFREDKARTTEQLFVAWDASESLAQTCANYDELLKQLQAREENSD